GGRGLERTRAAAIVLARKGAGLVLSVGVSRRIDGQRRPSVDFNREPSPFRLSQSPSAPGGSSPLPPGEGRLRRLRRATLRERVPPYCTEGGLSHEIGRAHV